MTRFKRAAALAIAGVPMLAASASAQTVIENFNEYPNNTTLATQSNSPPAPWLEFGTANNGQFTAKTDAAHEVATSESGSAPSIWTATGGNTLTLRFDYTYATHPGVQNYATAGYTAATINVRSSAAATTAGLQLSFTDGNSAYTSTAVTPISSSAQPYTFSLAQGSFRSASGMESFATVFSQISAIGFVETNTSSTPTALTESIFYDDFAVVAPEPASAAILLGGVGLLSMRRRRVSI